VSHTVSVGEFEGPLGLLLQLIERGNIEVTQISVASITTQYLERLHQLPDQSPEHLSEFLQLGARLLHIKSLALLPGDTAIEHTVELQRLNDELAEYRRFQQLARELATRSQYQTWERPVTERLTGADLPLPRVTLEQLSAAFITALNRTRPALETATILNHISLETIMKRLHRRLQAGFNLDTLIASCENQLEIIVTFLAVLELVREGSARVSQTQQFAAITVEATRA
jgi:segregation and condensation protein A